MSRAPALTPAQAINTVWGITANLARLFSWLVFWIAHLLLALAGAALLWWFQVTPEDLIRAVTGASQSTTFSVLGFAGLSVLGILGGYLTIARWIWRKTFLPWMTEKLFEGMPVER